MLVHLGQLRPPSSTTSTTTGTSRATLCSAPTTPTSTSRSSTTATRAEDDYAFIQVTCDEAGEFELSAWEDGVTDNVVTNDYICVNAPTTATIFATPTTVESVPLWATSRTRCSSSP